MVRTLVGWLVCCIFLSCGGRRVAHVVVGTAGAPDSALSAQLIGLQPARSASRSTAHKRLQARIKELLAYHDDSRLHLQVDKSICRPGEAIWFRVWERNARTLEAVDSGDELKVELFDPRGKVILSDRAAAGEIGFAIPASAAGGLYQLRATSPLAHMVTRQILVTTYAAPRIRKEIELDREKYHPGDEVVANVSLSRATGDPLSNHRFRVAAAVDDDKLAPITATTNASGRATVRFALPGQIRAGRARLTLSVKDAGVTEAVQKPIPVHLGEVEVAFYPEGGGLVRGLPGRVYFAATNRAGEPVEVAGRVVDSRGQTVARFESVHDGMGRFELTVSELGHKVFLDKPAGIDREYWFVDTSAEGCSMVSADLDDHRNDVRMGVWCTKPQPVILTAVMRGELVDHVAVDVPAGAPALISLPLRRARQGVVQVSLFSAKPEPLAERLLYRNRGVDLALSVTANRTRVSPRDPVTLAIEARAADGKPVQADVAVVAVDSTSFALAEDHRSSLAAAILLEAELPGHRLRRPERYLQDTSEATRDLDLLLGTRGWREFTWVEAARDAVPVSTKLVPHDFRKDELDGDLVKPCGTCVDTRSFGSSSSSHYRPPPGPPQALGGAALEPPHLTKPSVAPYRRLEVVRKFAAPPPRTPGGARDQFRDTIAFSTVKTDKQGKAEVTLRTSDAITEFHVSAQGVGGGLIGAAETRVTSVVPIALELVLPHEVGVGDELEAPLVVTNNTDEAKTIDLAVNAGASFRLQGTTPPTITVAASQRKSLALRLNAIKESVSETDALIAVAARSGELTDQISRSVPVSPRPSYPRAIHGSGVVGGNDKPGRANIAFTLSEGVPGTLKGNLELFASHLVSMERAALAMIKKPHGCFEQTSSANYPNLMALEFIRVRKLKRPKVVARANRHLRDGYARLAAFEVAGGGFDLYGKGPAQEALTAYGLMQFVDMQRIWGGVSEALIQRTRGWLRTRRDGQGGYNVSRGQRGSFSQPKGDLVDAYITWALVEAGEGDLEQEIERVAQIGARHPDPYIVALAANTLLSSRPTSAQSKQILDRLAAMQQRDGKFLGRSSITRAWGEAATLEATALAALALVRENQRDAVKNRALSYLYAQRRAGMFGSTQATVLTLKALTASMAGKKPAPVETVRAVLNGKSLPELTIEDAHGRYSLSGFEKHLRAGKNQLEISTQGGDDGVAFQLTGTWRSSTPAQQRGRIHIETSLDRTSLAVGTSAKLRVDILNSSTGWVWSPLVRVGIPAGMSVAAFQLDALVKNGVIAHYETRPREVILYLRGLAQGKRVTVLLDLLAKIGGRYAAPPSRAYEYYSAKHQQWAAPLHVEIVQP